MILERQYMIAGSLLLLFVILTIPVNLIINSKSDQLSLPLAGSPEGIIHISDLYDESQKGKIASLPLPEDPQKYNIGIKAEGDVPINQVQWDFDLKRAVVESKILGQMDSSRAFKGLKISKKEYDHRLEKINTQIENFERIREDNPSDLDAFNRLQSLYMLKSTLKALKGEVISAAN